MTSISPALRFKDDHGNNFPEWEEKKLGDVASLISGHHLSPDDYNSDGEGVPYFTGPSDFTNDPADFTKWTKLNSKAAPIDSVLITVKGSGVGKLMYSHIPMVAMGRQLMAVKSENSSNFLIYQFLHTKAQHFEALASGNMIPGLSRPDLLSIKIPTATLPEQRKIADFLTAVDGRIGQLIQKKALLEDYKKGVMQQLFTQAIRFKDDHGNDFPDWEEVEIGEVLGYEQPTKYIVKSTEYRDEHPTPVLTAGKTFILGYTDETDGICDAGLPLIIFDDFTTAYKFVDFPFKVKSSAMKILRAKDNDWDIRFVHNAMSTIRFPKGEHKRYWIGEYQFMTIPAPSPEEQTKIADFLSAIDRKIESVTTQITATQTFKRGLLQQMFV